MAPPGPAFSATLSHPNSWGYSSTFVLLLRALARGKLDAVRKMLIAFFILVMSVAALLQFAVFSWHAGVLRVASLSVIDDADAAAPVYRKILESKDFDEVVGYQKVCPALGAPSTSMFSVRCYYSLLKSARTWAGRAGDGLGSWISQEMALCTRYAAVVMIQRLERNHAFATEVESF
jgi:hypothetical protein